jgi:hypothetical protein
MGITKQGAHHLLDKALGDRPIACRDCGAVIIEDGMAMDTITPAAHRGRAGRDVERG